MSRAHIGLMALTLALAALPDAAYAFKFETVMVPMHDGVHLATDVFRPSLPGKYPTVLIRTTYGRDFVPDEAARILCDVLKFNLIAQDTRGRYDSEGVDDVFLSDGWGTNQDGFDTIEWIAGQRWSNAKVGIFGVSALGMTGYMAAGSYPPALKTMHIGIAPWVFYNTVYQGGAFRNALVVNWLADQDASYMVDLYKEHPVYDELWAQMDLRERAPGISMPIFHWGGYYDVFTEGPVDAFAQLHAQELAGITGTQKLLMGPWTHMDKGAFSTQQGELVYPTDSIVPMDFANPVTWFQVQLQGKPDRSSQPADWPVRFYVMGDVDRADSAGNHWEIAQNWPIASSSRNLYLQPGGGLSWTAPTQATGSVSYVYDPADPCPTIGGGELYLPAGPHDERPLLDRSDVVMFQTDVLYTPVKVVGKIHANLFVSSDAPDTDFAVRVVDVYPDGRAMLVTDSILKARYRNGVDSPVLLTDGVVAELDIPVGTTSIVFDEGHRIQVLISSSNYSRFEASRNTGDGVWGTDPAVPATNTIYFDSLHPSHLVLTEPLAGTTRPAPKTVAPSKALIAQAMSRSQKGLPLTAQQLKALEFEGGRLMMDMALQTLPR